MYRYVKRVSTSLYNEIDPNYLDANLYKTISSSEIRSWSRQFSILSVPGANRFVSIWQKRHSQGIAVIGI